MPTIKLTLVNGTNEPADADLHVDTEEGGEQWPHVRGVPSGQQGHDEMGHAALAVLTQTGANPNPTRITLPESNITRTLQQTITAPQGKHFVSATMTIDANHSAQIYAHLNTGDTFVYPLV